MKICWDNLEGLRYSKKKGKWYKGTTTFIYVKACKTCDEPFLTCSGTNNIMSYCCYKCQPNFRLGKKYPEICGEKHPNWNGGYNSKNIPAYNTYAHQISWCEEVRWSPEDENVLQVKCTNSNCRKWFTPKVDDVSHRIKFLYGKQQGESRFYCSQECKKLCSIFYQQKYPKDKKPYVYRSSQHEWSEMVKERDGYKCTKCGSTEGLIAHHREGIRWEPLESADIDIGVTLCKKCERKVHKVEGCTYQDMQCNQGSEI